MREPNHTRKARMYSTASTLLAAASEGADSTLTMIVCTIFMTPVCILIYWWLEKTQQNERNETNRKRR